jgi:hypothetical protein
VEKPHEPKQLSLEISFENEDEEHSLGQISQPLDTKEDDA